MERATDFSGPKSLCRWAKGDIANFEAAEKAFFDENPGVDFQELDYRTNIMTFGIRLPVVAPDELAKSGYRIINDLRNALDQAALCRFLHAAA